MSPTRPAEVFTPRSWVDVVREAERGPLDFVTLEGGLRLREQNGRNYHLDVVGRPDTFTGYDARLA